MRVTRQKKVETTEKYSPRRTEEKAVVVEDKDDETELIGSELRAAWSDHHGTEV